MSNENLLYSIGELYSMLCGDLNRKEIQKGLGLANTLCFTAETNTIV